MSECHVIKTSCYIAGILDTLSLMALDSEVYWIPVIGVLVSTGWLLLVAKEGEHHKKTRRDQAGDLQAGADQAAHDRPDPSDLEEAGHIE